jgi:hypothetical protein
MIMGFTYISSFSGQYSITTLFSLFEMILKNGSEKTMALRKLSAVAVILTATGLILYSVSQFVFFM